MSQPHRRIVFAAAALLCGCALEVGNGELATQSRFADLFDRVSISDGIRAEVGLGPPALSLSGDSNLLGFVETFVDGPRLVVRVRPDIVISTSLGIRATVVTEQLIGLEASGGSPVTATASPADRWLVEASGGSPVSVFQLDTHRFDAVASGGSRITATGEAQSVKLVASGGSRIDTDEVPAVDALLEGSGGSTFRLRASHSVTGALSGGSTATVSGYPSTNGVSLSGGSTIQFAE